MLQYDIDLNTGGNIEDAELIYLYFLDGEEITKKEFKALGGFLVAKYKIDAETQKFFEKDYSHLFDDLRHELYCNCF